MTSRMSDKIFRTAVSVEWLVWYAEPTGVEVEGQCWDRRPVELRWARSCRAMSLSRSFEMTERLDMGRYDRTSAGSISTLFRPGEMSASLMMAGKQPVDSEQLNRTVRKGARSWMTALRFVVGIGSTAHILKDSFVSVASRSCAIADTLRFGANELIPSIQQLTGAISSFYLGIHYIT